MTPPPARSELQEEYVLEILRAARLLEAEGERLFRPHGMTVAQFNVLNLLAYREAMPQSELKRVLVVGKATVSSIVGGLLARNWVVQRGDQADRRVNLLALTARGREAWQKAAHDYGANLLLRFPQVGAADVKRLKQVLAPCLQLEPTL